jgi:hypothetical protein
MASATTTFPSSAPNNSPLPQVSGPNGELFGPVSIRPDFTSSE